jgi:hypothetical protein
VNPTAAPEEKARKQQEVEKELEEKAKKEPRTAGVERGRRWRIRQEVLGRRNSNRSSSIQSQQ